MSTIRHIKLYIIALLVITCLHSFSQQGISIREMEVKTKDSLVIAEVMISGKKDIVLKDALYYWFYEGKIFCNQKGFSGYPLHGSYKVFDNQRRMICSGSFSYGIKEGEWKYWDSKGFLKKREVYKSGHLKGDPIMFDENGKVKKQKFVLFRKKEKNTFEEPPKKESNSTDTIAKTSSKKSFFKRKKAEEIKEQVQK